MTLVPDWYEDYMALAGGPVPIRDASGQLVVFDPADESGNNPIQNAYVASNFELPAAQLAVAASNATGATSLGLPPAPINLLTAVVIPNDGTMGGALQAMRDYRYQVYGLTGDQLGQVRTSSALLVGERTGVRPGVLPRIVLPLHARNDRGGPF